MELVAMNIYVPDDDDPAATPRGGVVGEITLRLTAQNYGRAFEALMSAANKVGAD
jgi:hypothetical protein